jgi:hypothetical protein
MLTADDDPLTVQHVGDRLGPELAWPALELGLCEPHELQEARVGPDATVVTLVQLRQPDVIKCVPWWARQVDCGNPV